MTAWHEDNIEVLPAGTGAKPWLPAEPVEVPVCVAGNYNSKIGIARLYAGDDGALRADVTFAEGINPEGFEHNFGVDGQVLEERIANGVRTVERVRIMCLAVAAVPSVKS